MKQKVKSKAPAKSAAKAAAKPMIRVQHLPAITPGKYADGMPFDEIRYLECKLILKPNHFNSRQSLFDFAKVLRRPARDTGVIFEPVTFQERPLAIREVLFIDTHDFKLYNNAFILRRRIPYQDGFPVGIPEIVFKFRHTDPQRTAELDMRPHINGDYRIKFKAEALPLKDGLGGMRMLYSHNVEFHLNAAVVSDQMSMERIAQALPNAARTRRPARGSACSCPTIAIRRRSITGSRSARAAIQCTRKRWRSCATAACT